MVFMDPEAHEALEAARSTHSADAYYSLGLLFSTGQGVEMDYVQAHKWFNLAAMKGKSEAREWRAELAREMSEIEIAAAQREAREWLASD